MKQVPSAVDLLLLTRLSVRLSKDSAPASDEWLRERVVLFQRFCAPSVNAQTVRPTLWILFFDVATPEWFVEAVAASVEVPHSLVRLSEPWSPRVAAGAVAEASEAPFLITSRVDSDDALGRRFVEVVVAQFAEQQLAFVNLLEGGQWSKHAVSRYSHPSNAFTSCIERRTASGPVTVFVDSHDKLDQHGPLIQVGGTEPMWLLVVHGGNLLNGESGWPVQPQEVLGHVVVAVDGDPLSRARLTFLRVRALGLLAIRVASRPSRLRWIPRYLRARVGRRGAR